MSLQSKDNSLSRNFMRKDRMLRCKRLQNYVTNHAFSTNPEGAHLPQATNIDNKCFFGNTLVLAHEQTVGIFDFLDDLDVVGYLLHSIKQLDILLVKDVRTNPCSIIQRFLGYEKAQIMTFRQLYAIKGNFSEASYPINLTNFLKSRHRITRSAASTVQLIKDPPKTFFHYCYF